MTDPVSTPSPAQRATSVEQAKPLRLDWGTIQWLVSDRQLPDAQLTFGFVQINPKTKNTKHYHPNCDEVLYLLEGELDHSLDGAIVRLTPGMAIHIPSGVKHDAVNLTGSVARMLVAYSSGDRQTVMCEEGQE